MDGRTDRQADIDRQTTVILLDPLKDRGPKCFLFIEIFRYSDIGVNSFKNQSGVCLG